MIEKRLLISTDWFSLDTTSLFDKIINVAIISKDKKVYYLRTDYMPYAANGFSTTGIRTYTIKKVLYKSDISIECDNFNTGETITSINIKLNIKNFYMFDTNGEIIRNFSTLGVDKVIVQTGYFGNFKNIPHETIADLTTNFFDYEENRQRGINTMVIESLASIYTQGMPPNSSLEINGFVGTTCYADNPERLTKFQLGEQGDKQQISVNGSIGNLLNALSNIDKLTMFGDKGDDVFVLYEKLKAEVGDNFLTQKLVANRQVITILTKKDIDLLYSLNSSARISAIFKGNSITFDVNNETQSIDYVKQIFNIPFKVDKDGQGNVIYYTDKLTPEDIANAKINGIKDVASVYSRKLLAVYNITYSAVCEIQAPVFYWIDAYTEIDFKTSYWTANSIYYYMNTTRQPNNFIAICSKLEFATTQDKNKITIKAVEKKEDI